MRPDIIAGITTAVVLVPQGMAYAMLAGLPPVVGLYASVFPLVAYAALGTSRQLAVGPVAIDSLLVATAVGAIAQVGSEQYLALAIALACLAGLIQLGLGLLRGGFIANFLSNPVITGFTSAAAVLIIVSQLKHMLGVQIPRSDYLHQTLASLGRNVADLHAPTVAFAATAAVALVAFKKLAPKLPGPLIVIVAATVVSAVVGAEAFGVAIVGEVSGAIPIPHFPSLAWADVAKLLPTAAVLALVSFVESYAIADGFARKNGYEIKPDRELLGLGAANIVSGLFGGLSVSGGMSRTTINAQAGARTRWAAIVTAIVVLVAVATLSSVLRFIPVAALAALVVTAVFGLIDVQEFRRLFSVKPSDFRIGVLTFVATLLLGIVPGIVIGVASSLVWFFLRATRPHTAVLGRIPGTSAYRNVDNFDDVITTPGLLVVRMDASYVFGNVAFLRDTLRSLEKAAPEPIKALVLDFSAINELDSSAASSLTRLFDGFATQGTVLSIANIKGPVREVFSRCDMWSKLSTDTLHLSVHEAVVHACAEAALPLLIDGCVRPREHCRASAGCGELRKVTCVTAASLAGGATYKPSPKGPA